MNKAIKVSHKLLGLDFKLPQHSNHLHILFWTFNLSHKETAMKLVNDILAFEDFNASSRDQKINAVKKVIQHGNPVKSGQALNVTNKNSYLKIFRKVHFSLEDWRILKIILTFGPGNVPTLPHILVRGFHKRTITRIILLKTFYCFRCFLQ